jgi:NADPH2:quinone reductase
MLHRSRLVSAGRRACYPDGAAGGVGDGTLQLGHLAGLRCTAPFPVRRASPAVSDPGGIPIDYQHQDFGRKIAPPRGEGGTRFLTPIAGAHLWQSRKALRRGGGSLAGGTTSRYAGRDVASGRPVAVTAFTEFRFTCPHRWRLAAGRNALRPLQHPAPAVETGLVPTGLDDLA